jgi:hypothetical protein
MDLRDIYRVSHPGTAQYTLYSASHGICSKINHILGHKTSFNKSKKIEIPPAIILEFTNK